MSAGFAGSSSAVIGRRAVEHVGPHEHRHPGVQRARHSPDMDALRRSRHGRANPKVKPQP
jgi:hypothetical protein